MKSRESKKSLPRIVSNIQVVPLREEAQLLQASQGGTEGDDEWQTVENKTTKKKKARTAKRQETQASKKTNQDKKEVNPSGKSQAKINSAPQKRRPPRTAAVAIKGITEGFSYASALRSLRDKIALPDLKIENSHIRKAANRGIIIEIPGEEKAAKADKLKDKIMEVLGDTAKVTRPKIKGEIRLIGIDDSVVPDEVADTLAMAGGCLSEEVKVAAIRPMSNVYIQSGHVVRLVQPLRRRRQGN